MIDILNLAVPYFGLIFIGYACGRAKGLPEQGLAWMNFFLLYVSLPALLFGITAKTPFAELNNPPFLIATTLGTMIALASHRYSFRGKKLLDAVLVMNIAASEVVIGASLLTLFVAGNVPLGFVTIVLAQVMFSIPFVAITVRARLVGFDKSLEEAAQDLGASPLWTFLLVTLPIILPGVMAAALLAFALCLDDYVITSFVSGGTLTFPLWVYGATRNGVPPQVNVIGTFIFIAGGLLAISFALLRSWRNRQLEHEATL